MISTGIYLASDNIRIVTLSGSKKAHNRISKKVHKLKLPLTSTQEEIAIFIQTLKAYCSDNEVEKIIINRRSHTRKYASGAATFRNEGIIFAGSPVSVQLVHHSTLDATDRKQSKYKIDKPATKDLGIAYDLAFEGLD